MSPQYGEKVNLCGDRVRQLRQAKRITLMELAVEVEEAYGIRMERSVLGKIEQGKRYITDFELVALADALGVTPGDLLTGEGALSLEAFVRSRNAEEKTDVA